METLEEKHQATIDFFKEAFCIDGECSINAEEINLNGKYGVITMTDSKRGTIRLIHWPVEHPKGG